MLAYAAHRSVAGKRESSPNALLLIASAHIALIAFVMSSKMAFPTKAPPGTTIVTFLPDPTPPPPNRAPPPRPLTTSTASGAAPQPLPLPSPDPVHVDRGANADGGPSIGPGTFVAPPFPTIPPVPVRHEPRLLTPPSELRPPYPPSKILSEEEAVLRLRLSISDSGRVTAVDPVGSADRAFLDAARRYLIAHWRYQPATEDGRAIGSTMVIRLRFQLDG